MSCVWPPTDRQKERIDTNWADELSNVHELMDSSKSDVCNSREKRILFLYGVERFSTLDEFRYYAYSKAIGSSSSFNLATLPPTSAAAKQHSYRTYHQVQQWLGNKQFPIKWGWRLTHGCLIPVPTELLPAPDKLLKMISCCSCKKFCSRQCSCRRAQLPCSPMCKNCMGLDCSNTQPVDMDDENINNM